MRYLAISKLKVGLTVGAMVLVCSVPPLVARAEDKATAELVVVVHPDNRAQLSAADIESVFLMKKRAWPDGSPIIPFNYAPGDPVRRAFERVVLRLGGDEVARYWLDQRIRSGMRAPRQIGDPSVAVRLVARVKGTIAYVPASSAGSSVRVIARIRGDKVVSP
jgi:hypothetical protein